MKKLAGILQALKTKTIDSIRLSPKIVRKPKLFFYWLISARWAQFALLLVVIGLPNVIPTIVDAQLEKLYPPVIEKKFLGLVKQAKPNPLFENRRKASIIALWSGSGAIVIFLLFLHIPQAISKTTAMARKRENEADALAASNPLSSMMLYNSALSLVSDLTLESSITQKIKNIDLQISGTIHTGESGESKKPSNLTTVVETKNIEPFSQNSSDNKNDETRWIPEDMEPDCIGPNDRYLIRHELGRGAMGIVYCAQDQILGRNVALKKLPSDLREDTDLIRRFKQEARALARLSHPHVVQVYDFLQDCGQAWIAMELIEGSNLADYLDHEGAIPISEAVRLATQMAEGLAYAHERGVIHRDFKPANVILSDDGAVKITDFGLAKIAQSSVQTQVGSLLGSPAYMSPEQTQGKAVDAHSDIYSAGVTFYEMISGRIPFTGDFESIIAQKLTQSPVPLSDLNGGVPKRLKQLVFQMLAKESHKRPENMNQVAEVLRTVSG
jgi:tRNA A-37 threonylcarbamoyl transferase component Bud32